MTIHECPSAKGTAPPKAAGPRRAAPRLKKTVLFVIAGATLQAAPRRAAPRNESWEKFIFHGQSVANHNSHKSHVS